MLTTTRTGFRRTAPCSSIRFCCQPTWLGGSLIAVTDMGLCAVFFGDEPKALQADLRRRFAGTELVESLPEDRDFAALVLTVNRAIENPSLPFEMNLDLHGTPFQQKVWKSLMSIPFGQTISYSELAERVGKPNAIRAVASACGANPISVIVPCHRVVRSDGSLSGYRWGIERKQKLIKRESVVSSS